MHIVICRYVITGCDLHAIVIRVHIGLTGPHQSESNANGHVPIEIEMDGGSTNYERCHLSVRKLSLPLRNAGNEPSTYDKVTRKVPLRGKGREQDLASGRAFCPLVIALCECLRYVRLVVHR